MLFGEDQLMEHDFLRSGVDIVHLLRPGQRVAGLQLLGDALGGFHLVDDGFQALLGLLVQVGQVRPEGPAQNHIGI